MSYSRKYLVIVAVFILIATYFGYRQFFKKEIELPKGISQEIIATTPGGIERKIMETQGVRHSIPLEEIISGGPPKDGIPSIDNPKFVSVAEANKFLGDSEPGVAFSRGNIHRFYPYQILVWHEIVNDTIGGGRILVTYCPLCLTGYIFDPVVKDERVEFGTSGKLWKSNLVMYDRKTNSLWPQVLGEAVVGEVTGAKLPVLPSDQMRYSDWKRKFSNGQILSQDTGAVRFYGSNPYGDYFKPIDFALNLAGRQDNRLPPEAFVFGLVSDRKAKAYFVEAIKRKREVRDEFEGKKIVLRYEEDLDVVRVYNIVNGKEERINPFSAFWFSWASAHPETELLK